MIGSPARCFSILAAMGAGRRSARAGRQDLCLDPRWRDRAIVARRRETGSLRQYRRPPARSGIRPRRHAVMSPTPIAGFLQSTAMATVRLLADKASDGSPILYADDLDVAFDGTVYFSDASTRFSAKAIGEFASSIDPRPDGAFRQWPHPEIRAGRAPGRRGRQRPQLPQRRGAGAGRELPDRGRDRQLPDSQIRASPGTFGRAAGDSRQPARFSRQRQSRPRRHLLDRAYQPAQRHRRSRFPATRSCAK